MTEEQARKKTNDKIEKLYQMAENKLNEAKSDQDTDVARRMLIAGLDVAIVATQNAIERMKKENELY